MAALASVTKFTGKIVPTSKGVIQNFVTGVGADSTMRIIDNVFGAPVQRIFSFNIPLLGNIGPIDFLNYVAHAGGFKISKKGFIAVGAAKFANGALTQLGPIRLPQTVTAAQSTPSVASASGNSGGLPI
jgi:hypothetical protein